MEERLKQVLRELGYTDDEIHLETSRGGKLTGYIVSEAFRGESQIHRQNQLWAELQRLMRPDELRCIAAILTMTPAEVAS